MRRPIPAVKAEELILYYAKLYYRWLSGEAIKIEYELKLKAEELGFGLRSAFRLIKQAREFGMLDY